MFKRAIIRTLVLALLLLPSHGSLHAAALVMRSARTGAQAPSSAVRMSMPLGIPGGSLRVRVGVPGLSGAITLPSSAVPRLSKTTAASPIWTPVPSAAAAPHSPPMVSAEIVPLQKTPSSVSPEAPAASGLSQPIVGSLSKSVDSLKADLGPKTGGEDAKVAADAVFGIRRGKGGLGALAVSGRGPLEGGSLRLEGKGESKGAGNSSQIPAPQVKPLSEVPSATASTWLPKAEREAALKWFHIGRVAHFAGQFLLGVALPIFLFKLVGEGLIPNITGSGTLSTVLAFGSLGYFAMALGTGTILNRFGTKKVLAGSVIAMSVAALALPVMYWTGVLPLWLLVTVNIGLSALGAAHAVAEATIIPALVGKGGGELQKTNLTLEITYGITAAISAAIAGFLISWWGPISVLLMFPAIHLLFVLPIYLKKLPSVQVYAKSKADSWGDSFRSARKGLRVMMASVPLMAFFALLAASDFITTPVRSALIPIINEISFSGAATFVGWAYFAFYAGHSASNYLARRYSSPKAMMRWIRLAGLGFLPLALLGFMPLTPMSLIIGLGILSFMTAPARTMIRTLIQREVSEKAPRQLGFIIGVFTAVMSLASALGIAAIGLLGSTLTPVFPGLLFWLAPAFAAAGLLYLAAPRILKGRMVEPKGEE